MSIWNTQTAAAEASVPADLIG